MLTYTDRENDTLVYYETAQDALEYLLRENVVAGNLYSPLVSWGGKRRKNSTLVYAANSRGREREESVLEFIPLAEEEIARCKESVPLACVDERGEYWVNGPRLEASKKRPGKWYIKYPK